MDKKRTLSVVGRSHLADPFLVYLFVVDACSVIREELIRTACSIERGGVRRVCICSPEWLPGGEEENSQAGVVGVGRMGRSFGFEMRVSSGRWCRAPRAHGTGGVARAKAAGLAERESKVETSENHRESRA